jgi:hypothetical protein
MKIELTQDEAQNIVNYLAAQPFREVVNIISPLITQMQKTIANPTETNNLENNETSSSNNNSSGDNPPQ